MAALAVVEDFDEVEECELGLSACGEGGPVDQLPDLALGRLQLGLGTGQTRTDFRSQSLSSQFAS